MLGELEKSMVFLQELSKGTAGAINKIQADERLKVEVKQAEIADLRERSAARLPELLRRTWGNEQDATQQLQGGAAWEALGDAEQRVRTAKTGADTLDQTRLSNEYQRLPGLLRQCDTLQDVQAMYDRGGEYTRRSLQDIGETPIQARFDRQPGLGSLFETMKRDRAASVATPELVEAQEYSDQVTAKCAELYETGKAVARDLGLSGVWETPQKILGQVKHESTVPDARTLEIVHSFSKAPPLMPWRPRENVALTMGATTGEAEGAEGLR